MQLKDIRNYLIDGGFNINVTDKYVDVINYSRLGHFDSKSILVYSTNLTVKITGDNMKITKLMNKEILIIGNITLIELR